MVLKKIVYRWLPVLFWAGMIFYFSSLPNLKTADHPAVDEILRSLIHFIVYFVFALLWYRALGKDKTGVHYQVLLFVFLYSLSDEWHQSLVPTRTLQIRDLAVDNLGSLAAVWLVRSYLPQQSRRFQEKFNQLFTWPNIR